MSVGQIIKFYRKEKGFTQGDLAEIIGVSVQAVSKWERGKSLPDAAIMLDLCALLNITVNDLLSGEVISMDNQNKRTEELILEMAKQKEESDKRLLFSEILVGVLCIVVMLALTVIASVCPMEEWLRITLILIGLFPILFASPFMLKIEQTAGYYECKECKHRYVPSYKSVFIAPHVNRTRYMKCPECGKKSWQKKVLTKD